MKPIWIVDDDQSIRFVLEKALAREELAVRSFTNSRDVLKAVAELGLAAITVRRDAGKLYGPGVSDNSSGITALLALAGAMQAVEARQVLEPVILRAAREIGRKYYWRIEFFNDDPRTTHADILRVLPISPKFQETVTLRGNVAEAE